MLKMYNQIFTVSVFCSLLSHVYPNPVNRTCGGDIIVDEKGGNITTPNFPEPYPSRTTCEWVLSAPDNMQIILTFESFQLEDRTSAGNNCLDFVEIRNGGRANSPFIGSYCSNESLPVIRSTGNELSVRFTSDYHTENNGFLAVYSRILAMTGEKEDKIDGTATRPIKGCSCNLTEMLIAANITFLVGPPGPKGDEGRPGPPGDRGIQGATGPQGFKGEPGSPGVNGLLGPKGESGKDGLPGPQGAPGLPGNKGDRGNEGERGQKGDAGIPGPTGPQGLEGKSGPPRTAGLFKYSTPDPILSGDLL